jgi:hypothetical protein
MNEDLKRLERAADIQEIQMLQGRYMFYLDEMSYEKILNNLMAKDHPEVSFELEESGCFEGPAQVEKFLLGLQKILDEPKFGYMPMTTISTPYIIFSKDSKRARGYWHFFGPNAMEAVVYPSSDETLSAFWTGGKFENEYIKINGEWKILKLHQINWFRTPYEHGWIKQPDCRRVKVPAGCIPDKPPRVYTYHPDAYYTKDGPYNWGPFPGDDGSF